jgi:hypothetical protein
MPLRDHFRAPVNNTHSWDEVHGGWPGEIVRDLTTILPKGFRAGPRVHLGAAFDVSTFELDSRNPEEETRDSGTATATTLAPTLTIEADLSEVDEYQVRIFDTERGRELVATVEIVSPANKDRAETRDLFVSKVTTLLQQGICVSIVDLVTVRHANLYAELLEALGRTDPHLGDPPPPLYGVTLRSRKRPKKRLAMLDAWFYPMTVGDPLPTLPIWLTPELRVMLPLETSYQETCRILGIA